MKFELTTSIMEQVVNQKEKPKKKKGTSELHETIESYTVVIC